MTSMPKLCLLLLVGLASLSATAAEFLISPIRVELGAKNRFASVTVTNESATPLPFLLTGKSWTQDSNGNDVYAVTDEVVYAPQFLRVTKGEPRALRLGVPAPAGDVERTYRVWLDEQLEVPSTARAQINVAVSFGLPIFVKPRVERVAGEVAEAVREGNELAVRVRNSGNVHFMVEGLKAGASAGDVNPWYLLAGATRRYALPFDDAWCRKPDIEVVVATSRAELVRTVATGPLCQGR